MKPIKSSISRANKKLKLSIEEKDKLRDLPEPVLHHILSFLDLKEVVRTSVLSTGWKNIWATLPFLNFKFHKDGTAKAFREFVDQVLLLRDSSSNIHSFRLDTYCLKNYDDISSTHLNTWIITALRRNLQEFYLNLAVVGEGFRLPRYLFTCKSLTKLELQASDSTSSLKLNIHDSMSLPKLETLLLHHVTIEGGVIFSKCPSLESLTIRKCDFGHQSSLLFDMPKLKHFVIECLNYTGVDKKGYRIKLNAPSLISFHCKDYMLNQYSIDKKLSALVKAGIDFQREEGIVYDVEKLNSLIPWMVKFMEPLHNVEALTLSGLFPMCVGATIIAKLCGIYFHNLKYLKLVAELTEYTTKSLRNLLNISPNTETLFFEIIQANRMTLSWDQYLDEVSLVDKENVETSWNLEMKLQNLRHLKFVEIQGVQGRISEFLFLGLLLKRAVVLEKLTVLTFNSSKEDSSHRRRRLIKFAKNLSNLPRASSNASILFF